MYELKWLVTEFEKLEIDGITKALEYEESPVICVALEKLESGVFLVCKSLENEDDTLEFLRKHGIFLKLRYLGSESDESPHKDLSK
ncbi:hypothetical protein [Shewanella sp. UCD-KL12]|uniref:hypothetical protein n=1 Tax=Shewanella sp. UCD-KL12 TaxID=1917163 RepID=UPI0009705FA3|nr:hypothetical protein [Shewanella sp. UCD-KL12]